MQLASWRFFTNLGMRDDWGRVALECGVENASASAQHLH